VIYRRARDRDEVAIDPTERLDLPRPHGKRDRIPSAEEARALLDALPQDERALWATYLYAGLRRGEARALRCSDLALRAQQITVTREWNDVEGELQDGKTDAAARVVPIIGELLAELRDHQMRSGRRGSDLVFGRAPDQPFQPTTARRRAREAWQAAKLEPITPHECRHHFASLLIAAGVDARAVMEYMGHSSITETYNRYGHLFHNAREEAIKRVDAHLAAAQEAPEARLRGV
jgi:integrase